MNNRPTKNHHNNFLRHHIASNKRQSDYCFVHEISLTEQPRKILEDFLVG